MTVHCEGECGVLEQLGERYEFETELTRQGRVAFLLWLPITFKSRKPKKTDFEPRTLGEHIRKRRMQLGLTQVQAAAQIGVSAASVLN